MTQNTQLRGSLPMRYFWVIFGLLTGGILILLILLYPSQPLAYVGTCDLELVFIVTDKDTGEPIPDASIELTAEGRQENYQAKKIAPLITNETGVATFVREQNMCDDIYTPYRKTVRTIDYTWGIVMIVADGYESVKSLGLREASINEFKPERRRQRVELSMSLKKWAGK